MKLILQEDVKNLGKAGDQVQVKKGFARNFLIPRGMALPSQKGRLKMWRHQQAIISAKKKKAISSRKILVKRLSDLKIEFEKESLKDGRLFGSVTAYEISNFLERIHGVSVDKRDISPAVIKTVGEHKLTVHLDTENQAVILVFVKGKGSKKEEQRALDKELSTTDQDDELSSKESSSADQDDKLSSKELSTADQDDKLSSKESSSADQDDKLSSKESLSAGQDDKLSSKESSSAGQDDKLSSKE